MATILVADDQPMNRQFLTELLGQIGHRVLEATDGIEALEIARAERPDVMIVDTVLPRMDGMQLVRELRKNSDFASVKIVLCNPACESPLDPSLIDGLGVECVLQQPRVDELDRLAAELQRSYEELDEFAYVASHDLRTPLGGIKNLAKWVMEDNADTLAPASNRHLEQIEQRVDRLDRLLDDLLKYSRAGRIRDDITEVDSADLVRDAFALLNPPEGFRVLVNDDMPTFQTAHAPLEQVFSNLLDNAVKHHDRQQGTVEVNCCDEGEQYEFLVADDGPGIAPEFHSQVFKVFETLKPRDEVEGSGMGMAIVKKIVEGYGGRVVVESTDRGTTIRFTWPKQG